MVGTSRQLKDWINNLSRETGIEPYILMRRFMMERFLERVSLSKYKDQFILKGGMLVSAMVGIGSRATMDIDSTVKNYPLSTIETKRMIEEIIQVPVLDNITFNIRDVDEIMDMMEYSGIRISLESQFEGMVIPMKLDLSTGDVITPREVRYSYPLMFEDRSIELIVYPLETVLAEKLETILARTVTNTRMRDYYDIHILLAEHKDQIDVNLLDDALRATAKNRHSQNALDNAEEIISSIENNPGMYQLWKNYSEKNAYAKTTTWEEAISSVRSLSRYAGLEVQECQLIAEKMDTAR
ncbi:MAG: nucleotidyl transferase AbiEii/AbiGii toxin family protein [Oscillospiraceae bacterium]|nr:nucleotidyl transferase AbiEii/AbiGii toxin family protein [Oscillospiraceae bacterium]